MALMKKRLAEAQETAAAAAASNVKKEEAMGDVLAISAELMAAKTREQQKELAERHAEAAEAARASRTAADNARRKVERLQKEFEKESQAIKAKSKQMTDARAKALQERERKRAEQRNRLEAELTRRESERHKQVLSLKQVLNQHAEAKKKMAEEDVPEDGELPVPGQQTARGSQKGTLAVTSEGFKPSVLATPAPSMGPGSGGGSMGGWGSTPGSTAGAPGNGRGGMMGANRQPLGLSLAAHIAATSGAGEDRRDDPPAMRDARREPGGWDDRGQWPRESRDAREGVNQGGWNDPRDDRGGSYGGFGREPGGGFHGPWGGGGPDDRGRDVGAMGGGGGRMGMGMGMGMGMQGRTGWDQRGGGDRDHGNAPPPGGFGWDQRGGGDLRRSRSGWDQPGR